MPGKPLISVPRDSKAQAKLIVDNMNEVFAFSSTQCDTLENIVQGKLREIREVRKETEPQIEEIRKATEQQVRAALTPEPNKRNSMPY